MDVSVWHYWVAAGMGGSGEASVQQDSIATLAVQFPPCLVGQLQAGNLTTILEFVRLIMLENLIACQYFIICTFQLYSSFLLLKSVGHYVHHQLRSYLQATWPSMENNSRPSLQMRDV